MNMITGLPISIYWKGERYDLIFVIVDWLTEMLYYESVKLISNTPSLLKAILDVVVRHHNHFNSIVSDQNLLFNLDFPLPLYRYITLSAFHI